MLCITNTSVGESNLAALPERIEWPPVTLLEGLNMRSLKGRRAMFSSLVLTAALSACGGITHFEDTTPLVLGSPAAPAPSPPPEPEPARVEVKQDHIEIREKIQFAFDKAEILTVSDSLLGEVAGALQSHKEIKKVAIHGHTDSEGETTYNQSLSDRRAKAVKTWLTSHGVDAKRLDSKGFGESKPIGDNGTPEGREQNRRVEFLILDQEGVQ
jgi:outer membrane protein OmpA-like peptidoglycan-associated protein